VLLQRLLQARLRQDGGHDAQARGERERVHVPGILGLGQGHAQTAPFQGQGERQVAARELGAQQRHRLGRHRRQLRLRHQGEMEGIRQGLSQRGQLQQAQLDEVGAQTPPVDELRLQGLVQLRLGEESLADQMRSELFDHTAEIVETSAVPGPPRHAEKSGTIHIFTQVSGSPR
jgi:hypothetical protein